MALAISVFCPLCGGEVVNSSSRNERGCFICPKCSNEFSLLEAKDAKNRRNMEAKATANPFAKSKMNFDIELDKADDLVVNGQYELAREIYDRVLAENPKVSRAWIGKSKLRIIQEPVINFFGFEVNINMVVQMGKKEAIKALKKMGMNNDEAKQVVKFLNGDSVFTKINVEFARKALSVAETDVERDIAVSRLMYLEGKLHTNMGDYNYKTADDKNNKKMVVVFSLIAVALTALILSKIMGWLG